MRKSRKAGASTAGKVGIRDGTVRLASDIRFNDYIDIKGKPCRVLEAYTEGGFCYFHTINILDGYFVWEIAPSSKQIVIADVNREVYQLIAVSSKDNSVTLLHYGGNRVREDIKLPENEFLRSMMVCGIEDGKKVFVTIASALGKEAVYAVEVNFDQTGSAVGFKRNEDAVNQSKTNDSDVVVNQSKTKKSDVVVVNQNKAKDSDVVVVNQSKTNNSDVAKKACLKEKATKALLSQKRDRCANLSTAKYGYEYAQRSYRDVVLGHNATGEEIY